MSVLGNLSPVAAAIVEAGGQAEVGTAFVAFRFGGVAGRLSFESQVTPTPRTLTRCAVRLPVDAPVPEIDLRPATPREEREVLVGAAIDVSLGDEEFDKAFVVEAAPSRAVRLLLDADMRESLLALSPCRMWRDGETLMLDKEGGDLPVQVVLDMVATCLAAHGKMPLVTAEMALGRHNARTSARSLSYREPPALPPEDAVAAMELAELERVRNVQRRKRQLDAVERLYGPVAFVLVMVGWALLHSCAK